MDNLANENRPRAFNEFLRSDGGSIKVVQNLIARNLHSKMKTVWLTGPPGSGKSSLALLYARATLCRNRPEGESEPCGDCEVCRGEDTSNIYHYTITNSSEARDPIKALIAKANSYPVKITDREDQYRQFIIIDEFELAEPSLAAMLLDPLEHSPSTTTWIIISMDAEKLERRDPVIKEAIESRCAHFSLGSFTDEAMAQNMAEKIDGLDYEAALEIAASAGGNMRKAWNTLSFFLVTREPEELTPETVIESLSGGATDLDRESMWKALQEGDGERLKSYFDKWMAKTSDPKAVAKKLERDLLSFLSNPNAEVQEILSSLARWYNSPHPYPLLTVFISHLGIQLFPVAVEQPKEKVNKECLAKTNAGLSVAAQLLKIKATQLGIPKFFLSSSFTEISEVYR